MAKMNLEIILHLIQSQQDMVVVHDIRTTARRDFSGTVSADC